MQLTAFAASDPGLVRAGNEDSLYAGSTLFAVADGLGGHAAGEVASATAIEALAGLDGQSFPDPAAARQALEAAVVAANQAVAGKAAADPRLWGMGTTLTAALVEDARLHLAHVGDSRAYLLRRGEPLRQLTDDHTVVAELVREGRLSAEEAAVHPGRSILTQAIGLERDLVVDAPAPLALVPDDQVLLCSDGLTDVLADGRIAELLGRHDQGGQTCRALVDAANAAGGPDNVTVVLVRVAG